MPADLPDDALSPEDAAQVASLDAVRDGLVAEAKEWARRVEQLTALAARAERAGPQTRRTLALELAGSWQIGQLTAERWIAEAQWLVDALPLTVSMLACGELLAHQARVLLHCTLSGTPQVASAVERQVLPDGARLCPSDLRRRVQRVRLRIESEQTDPAEVQRQEAQKVAGRRTFARPTEDGMAIAGAVLTPEQAVAWASGLDALERRERIADRQAGIIRTAEQRRADLFAALPALVLAASADPGQPLSSERAAAQIVLNIHVPVSTVLDRSSEPGRLERYGPVSAEHVRLLRPQRYRRVLVDGHTGRPIAVDDRTTPVEADPDAARQQVLDLLRPAVVTDSDEPQHDPSARLARLIDLRDLHCAGPGCSSSRCDRDHLEPYPHGPTSARNLGLLSPRCHSAKHSGWTLLRHPDGSVTWTSTLRRQYDRPGPWDPPPQVDLLDAPPPPLRQPVRADALDDHDETLTQRLTPDAFTGTAPTRPRLGREPAVLTRCTADDPLAAACCRGASGVDLVGGCPR